MSSGKLASQAGHAYVEAFLLADPQRQSYYRADGLGTKICLRAPNQDTLHRLEQEAKAVGLPCALIEDTGNNTCFNGVPTVTALGIGPIKRSELPSLRKLPLMN
jgi:peptidyl-tRNA hydrolase